MDRHRLHTLQNSIDTEKIRKANQHIFEYLAAEGFNLFEIRYLAVSMTDILKIMQENDSLRLIKEFDYSSSVDRVFSASAISNTES